MDRKWLGRLAALILFVGGLIQINLCFAQSAAYGTSQSSAQVAPAKDSVAYNQELARVYVAIFMEARNHPDDDAIPWFIKKEALQPAPEAVLQQLHASHAYYKKVVGQSLIVSSDETPGSFCIFSSHVFDQHEFLDALTSRLSVHALENFGSGPVPTRVYQLSDHGKPVGKLLLVYGSAANVSNVGLIGYLSEKRYEPIKQAISKQASNPDSATNTAR